MKLYSWNVNGIRAVIKKGSLGQFLENEQPDILCLQETKASKDQVEVDLKDYFEYWHSGAKKGYSGTAIFSKIQPLKVRYGFSDTVLEKFHLMQDGYGDMSEEGRVISAEYNDFIVVNVYTPNAKGDLSRLNMRHEVWDPAFLEYLKELEQIKPILVCGDFNVAHKEIDLANPKQNIGKHGFTDEERQGFDNYIENNLIDSFRHFNKEPNNYTWWTHWANARARNIGWRIDYWLVSKIFLPNLIDAKIHPTIMGSDHCPVSITIKDTLK